MESGKSQLCSIFSAAELQDVQEQHVPVWAAMYERLDSDWRQHMEHSSDIIFTIFHDRINTYSTAH